MTKLSNKCRKCNAESSWKKTACKYCGKEVKIKTCDCKSDNFFCKNKCFILQTILIKKEENKDENTITKK